MRRFDSLETDGSELHRRKGEFQRERLIFLKIAAHEFCSPVACNRLAAARPAERTSIFADGNSGQTRWRAERYLLLPARSAPNAIAIARLCGPSAAQVMRDFSFGFSFLRVASSLEEGGPCGVACAHSACCLSSDV